MAGEREVEAINAIGAKAGDQVMVTTATGSYLKMTFLLYMVPVIALLAGVAIGVNLALLTGWDESLLGALTALATLIPAVVFVKVKGNRLAERNEYRPRVSRILYPRHQTP